MIKSPFKKILKLLFLIIGMIFLNGCNQDDLFKEDNSLQNQEIKLKKISFEEIMSKPKHYRFKKSLLEFKEIISQPINSSIQGKLVYNEDYNVYIDDESGYFVEKNDYQSYTFRMVRSENEHKLENIVFESKSNGTFTIKILTYDITYEEILQYGKEEIKNRNITYSIYNPQTEAISTLICGETWVLTDFPQFQGEVPGISQGDTLEHELRWILIAESCFSVIGGSGNGDGTGQGNGSNNGGDTGNGLGQGSSYGTNPSIPSTVTTPVFLDGKNPHIEELNRITDKNSIIRTYINNFRDNLNTPLIEEGIEFNNDGTPFPAQYNQYSGVKFFPVNMNNPLIRLHKHHDELHPIFSAEDILGMIDFFIQKNTIDSETAGNISFIMVSKTGLHTFRVNNPSEIQEFYSYYNTSHKKTAFLLTYQKNVIISSSETCNCTSGITFDNLLFSNFIAFFKEFVWGIDYYYAPHPTTNLNSSQYIWTKKN